VPSLAPRGVEFVGVFEDRAELVPGLRKARTIADMHRMVIESDRPGGTNVRARFRVVEVLSDSAGCLAPGDQVALVFRRPVGPSPLSRELVGQRFTVVLHEAFSFRYRGRFSCRPWREAVAGVARDKLALAGTR